jgi:catechol 2,3-dioxygenase-like lactoylglutathione lyase family enzyme
VISGFDHVVIAVRDLSAGIAAYETLLARPCIARFVSEGVATAVIELDNIAVELIAPEGDGNGAARLRAALDAGEGLKSLVFATDDVDAAHRRAERVGLAPQAISGPASGDAGAYRVFRTSTERTHGVRVFVLQREDEPPAQSATAEAVSGLDHVVIRSAHMERAAALYGARFGLDMRLDREITGNRFMFFRCGDAVVELVQDAARGDGDVLWGLSWRVADADAARARLAGAGVNVSEVRAGMKPGSRVFTVRDNSCGVPTLMIETTPKGG